MKNLSKEDLKKILLGSDYVSADDFKKAEDYSQKNKVGVIEYLLSERLITKDIVGQAFAESFGVDYADLNSRQPSKQQVLKIPEDIARKYNLVLFIENEDSVVLTTDDPKQKGISEALKPIFKNKKISIAYSLLEDIESIFINYRKNLQTRFVSIIEKQKSIAPEIIEEIISDAILFRSSDIHFEPQGEETVIRFRIDGVLHEAGRIQKEYYENILNRIKVQANLRIDEHQSAQDGAIRFQKDGMLIDMRISVVPTIEGEKVVIRLLSEYVRGFTLNDLGLSLEHQNYINTASKKPFGMILVTGPTGSGKTTTLYSILKNLNSSDVNITTIEDPVEYRMTGANQIQVNPKTGLSFAKGLKSIVRQDPDVILVGEIRDEETAEISVNAALTGHLLLSTFHANDASTTIPRLLDMGTEPFLLSSTLELVVAQRLVRKICEDCRYSYVEDFKNTSVEIKKYFGGKNITLYKGKGCESCGNVGYKDRTSIMEFIQSTPEMRKLILESPSSDQIWDLANKQGAKSLFEDGIEKVKKGITTVEELLRVATPSN